LKRPRVMLVHDTPEILVLCAEILREHYEIVGTAPDGKSAIAACGTTAPDVVVLDVFMPRLSGIEVAKLLRSAGCQAVIIFLSDDTESVMAALDAGGSAFVSKARIGSDLSIAIAEALSGRQFVSEMP
jgi:two-component system sensor histidine kinase ChiS